MHLVNCHRNALPLSRRVAASFNKRIGGRAAWRYIEQIV